MGVDCSGGRTKRQKLHDVNSNAECDRVGGDTASVPIQDADPSWLVNDEKGVKTVVAIDESLDDRKPAAVKKYSPDEDRELDSESPPHDDNDNDDDEVISSNQQKCKVFDAGDNNCNGGENESPSLPMAPSLEEYLVCGGHLKYAPRPEWFQFTKDPSEIAVTFTDASRDRTNPISMASTQSGSTAQCFPMQLARYTNENGGEDHPPPIDGVGDSLRNINQFSIHQGDEIAPAIGGYNPLLPPAAGRRINRWRGHHRSVLETVFMADERSQHLELAQQPQREFDRHWRQHDHANVDPGRNHNGILATLSLENNSFKPVLLRRAQLYQMARGVRPDQLARMHHPAKAPIPYAQMTVDHRRRHADEEGGEETEEGVFDDERVADAPNRFAGRDVAQSDDTLGLAVSTGIDPSPLSLSFRENVAVFGYEYDTALHKAIKLHATEAALRLIYEGACVDIPNAKGMTPLILASQEGNFDVVWALLNKGAKVNTAMPQRSGSTALIQASHFGHLAVVELLLIHGAEVDKANLKNTTALMRACQEGHEGVVRLLLSYNAAVNRLNDERMSSLMLASQRGHASIVGMLIKEGAYIDAKTYQDSTSLMLACKRKHLHVAKILVASGAELKFKDGKNRTVFETASRKGNDEFVRILTDSAQIRLMQDESRKERNFEVSRLWKLLQLEHATIQLGTTNMTIHNVVDSSVMGNGCHLRQLCKSKRALVLAMTLPAPLLELISSFIPLPLIWEKRLNLLTSRSHIDPDSAVFNALGMDHDSLVKMLFMLLPNYLPQHSAIIHDSDLIDEVLEEGGLLDALDASGVNPPTSFASWSAYRLWRSHLEVESLQTQRRACNYLQVLARAPPSFSSIIYTHPYDMPTALLSKLKAFHDIQSAVRRLSGGGIHFDS